MNIESRLVELLSPGEICSGTELGEQLGISRVAVKKRISGLIEQGMPVEAIQGKGYCLLPRTDLLTEEQIRSAIDPTIRKHLESIEIHQTLASTNAYLKSVPPPSAGSAKMVLAESQPEGQGRRGRVWSATPYRNLMMSVAWRYSHWPRNPAAMSLAFGIAVHRAVVEAGANNARIKWPNDILLGGKKLAGLLVEAGGEASGACDLVFGVGVNFYIDPQTGDVIDQKWQHLSSVDSADMSRNRMAANILSNLVETLLLYESEGFAPFAKYWNEHAAYVNSPVRLFNESRQLSGMLRGVDKTGVLILDGFDGQEHRFTQADISLRALEERPDDRLEDG